MKYVYSQCVLMLRAGVAVGLMLLIFAAPARAYVDPGSGTFVLQLLAAMAVGTLFYLRQIVTKIKKFLGKLFESNTGPEG